MLRTKALSVSLPGHDQGVASLFRHTLLQRPALGHISGFGAHTRLELAAARSGFYTLGSVAIRRLAEHLDIDVGGNTDVFGMTFNLVQSLLNTSGDDTLAILTKRLATMSLRPVRVPDEFMKLDETVVILGTGQRQKAKNEKNLLKTKDSAYQEFRQSFMKKARVIRQGAGGGNGRRKGGGKGAGGGRPWGDRRYPSQLQD